MPERRCLICGNAIRVHDDGLHNATVWRSSGDYGSTVYDSIADDQFLEVVICDDCIVEKNDLIEEVVVRRTTEVVERRPATFS